MNLVPATNSNTSVLVVSCDAYSDLWRPFFTLFFRYWPDCPYPVYLCANHLSYPDTRVTTLLTGPDTSWSSNLKWCLEGLPKDYLILFQEDFLLIKPVDTDMIKKLVLCCEQREAACLRIFPSPPPDRNIDDELQVGEISKGAAYRVSLQTAIWEKTVLYDLLIDGESPWDLENIGSGRSNALDKPFLSISIKERSRWPLDYFSTAVVQGKWVRQAVDLCTREGIVIDKSRRKTETEWSRVMRTCLVKLVHIKKMLPR